MPCAQQELWKALRGRGLHIRCEAPLGRYTVDFVQHSAKLVVEVDGYWHTVGDRPERDAERDGWIESQGYLIERVPTKDVERDVNVVASRIDRLVRLRLSGAAPAPPPSGPPGHLPPSRGKGSV